MSDIIQLPSRGESDAPEDHSIADVIDRHIGLLFMSSDLSGVRDAIRVWEDLIGLGLEHEAIPEERAFPALRTLEVWERRL